MRKSIEELRNLNTKNLLRYYKAERRRFFGAGYWCGCGCTSCDERERRRDGICIE